MSATASSTVPTVAPALPAVDAASHAERDPLRGRKVLALLALYLIWGSTYLAIAVAVETMPPFLMAAARHLLAGGLLFAWARRRSDEPLRLAHWRSAAIVGVALLTVGNGFVVWAETRVASGLAALLVATVPLWIVGLEAIRRDGARPSPAELLGVVLGFAGIVLLVGPAELAGGSRVDLLGAAALTAASLSWSAGSLYARRAPLPRSPFLATALEMLTGGGALLLIGLVGGEAASLDLGAITLRSWLAFAYLVVAGSLLAFTAYVWLLGVAKPTLVSTYAYVNPVVAVFLGWLILAEPVGSRTLVAAAVIVAGVAVITWRRGKRR